MVRCVALVLVLLSGYLLLDFPNVYHAKTSSFCSFSDKNFATDPKIAQSPKHEKHGICDTFAKMLPKNKNKKHGKTKTPKRRLVHENLAKHRVFLFFTKIPPKHKRRTPRGGRRTCFLVVVPFLRSSTELRHVRDPIIPKTEVGRSHPRQGHLRPF